MKHGDKIKIKGLKLMSRVGVPDEERAEAQELLVNVAIHPAASLQGLADDIEKTIDYDKVAREIRRVAGEGSRHLIETLAGDIAGVVLGFEGVAEARVEVRKFVLPDTEYVAVEVGRLVNISVPLNIP